MKRNMFDVTAVEQMVRSGEPLILAGDEKVLSKLPSGKWIGGTIPYFITNDGGAFSQDKIYVTRLPEYVKDIEAKTYDINTIDQIYKDAPSNGFSFIILPGFSEIHEAFALKSPSYDDFASTPLVGWISGCSLDEMSATCPKTYYSANNYNDKAVVFHIELPVNKIADLHIINIFQQGDGDTIEFPADGFSSTKALVNGKEVDFVKYIQDNNIDIKLPLVADIFGAMINTSFREINEAENRVDFYAPIFHGQKYKIAKPVEDYVNAFESMVPDNLENIITFSCNCILNYLYADLQGKKLKGITGPITFGEITYQLLNQTMVYLEIIDI